MSHKGKKNIWIMKKGGLKSMLHHSNSRHQRVNHDPLNSGNYIHKEISGVSVVGYI